MAALPYIQFYIADYLADTMHLSTEEHGAYLLLIFNYWQTGKPIPKNRLSVISRLSKEQWCLIEGTLSEFFVDDGTHWVHLRIERDLLNVTSATRSVKGDSKPKDYAGYLFFISSPDYEYVKIGFAKNPWARVAEYRNTHDSSLKVVATIKTVATTSKITVATLLPDEKNKDGWFVRSKLITSLISATKSAEITTVEGLCDYVANYNDYCSTSTVAATVVATPTTNTDPDPDPNTDIKTLSDSEKTPNRTDDDSPKSIQLAFEKIFWPAGLRKMAKARALPAFEKKYRAWKKTNGGPPEVFARMLAEDIQLRLSASVFGFDKLLPVSYLSGERWNDERPGNNLMLSQGMDYDIPEGFRGR